MLMHTHTYTHTGKNDFSEDIAKRTFAGGSSDIAAKVAAAAKNNLNNNWMLLNAIP